MPEPEYAGTIEQVVPGTDEVRIPIVAEQAHITKRVVETERVSVRTFAEEEQVVLRDQVARGRIEVTRVAIDREVAEAPLVRTEGELTIIPVLEERLIVEKRLFLVEELHLRRTTSTEEVAIPASIRRTQVEINRNPIQGSDQPGEI